MASLFDSITHSAMSRRRFIQASAAAAASLSLAGCGNSLTTASADKMTAQEGKWITAACWHNCGGRCLNKAYVVDGVVVRQKTDDTHPDSPDYFQQRACLRGRAQRNQVFGADRLKYPMKRKHWEPGGGDKSLRGRDEWVRISWDEALDLVAAELKKAKETYGNRSLFACGTEVGRLLNLYGGHITRWGTTSYGAWKFTPGKIGYSFNAGEETINDRIDLRGCETIILLGSNPAWSSAGSPSYHFLQMKQAGAKFIGIDPFYNDTYALLEADWIPTRPQTDVALLTGVAYTLITEDDPSTNPLIDWDFLKRCTIGFDGDSMPEGADPKENFKDYVLGTYDGVPKTPEWAAEICGVEPNTIRSLARQFTKTKKVAFLAGWASARNQNVDGLPQMIMTIGAMTGHIGKPGHCTGVSCHAGAGNGGDALVSPGKDGLPGVKNPLDDVFNDAHIWRSIVDGKYVYMGPGGQDPGVERDVDIHVIYHAGRALLQTTDGMNLGIEAHRKVDFVVTHAQFLTTTAKYSDIVLPINTEWERVGGFLTGNREMAIMYSQVTESLYEAKSDQWIVTELAKRLGFKPEELYPFDEKQQFFNKIAGSKVVTPDGKDFEPLVTITAADIAQWGVQGTPQQGRITLPELQEKGIYQVERYPGDNYGYIACADFVTDPEKNPLPSESGKFEIYCRSLAEVINGTGFSKIKPIPTHIPAPDGYESTFKDWGSKVKGDYPYQVLNPHYLRRSHTVFDNVQWLRETWPNPVFINTKDAESKGIMDGDTVLLTSRHGKTLRRACLTERFMPGVIGLPHGAWVDIDEKTGIDTAGADNILCGSVPTGQGVSGWNTCAVNMEKYAGAPLIPDIEKPQRIFF